MIRAWNTLDLFLTVSCAASGQVDKYKLPGDCEWLSMMANTLFWILES